MNNPVEESRDGIGLMDSGLGGLSVLVELRRKMPEVNLSYFADTAYCPYGLRSAEFIRQRSMVAARTLMDLGARVLVVACNTASAAGLEWLREELDIPVVGMEPAIKPAASATRNGRVGVLATGVTLEAERFARLLTAYASGIRVFSVPATDLVELVEQGQVYGPEAEAAVRQKLVPLVEHRIDTLVLGCTHYPFLKDLIAEFVGDEVAIIDTGPSVAAQAVRVYRAAGLTPRSACGVGLNRFATSGISAEVVFRARKLLPDLDFTPV